MQDRKVGNKMVYFILFIIILVGIVACFIIKPIYSDVIALIYWLFTDSQNIIGIMNDPKLVLQKDYNIIGARIFWYIWLFAFIISLFLVCKQLHAKPKANVNAKFTKKVPYLMIQNVSDTLKKIKKRENTKELDSLVYAVKCLEEKLSVESDFGYGDNNVINCENNIVEQLQSLTDVLNNIEIENISDDIDLLDNMVLNINFLLHRRMELKKR